MLSMGLLSSLCLCLQKKLKPANSAGADEADDEDVSTDIFFELNTLQIATNFFSEVNKLGNGGFGPVYKGLMPNGQQVAVKKLSIDSRQGVKQFSNEVKLLLRIQHRNLVILLGCCVEGPEKMLVYEYLPNRSLDYFIFDKKKSPSLDWTTRFHIITDFGLARLFPGEDTHLNTFKIAGTHGYMAPEYAIHGYLSVKSDIFSFGILVLEIVSGRKNHDIRLGAQQVDLLGYAWLLYQEGRVLELVDQSLTKYNVDEAAMCIQLGLLCCQAKVSDRPDMSTTHLMLSSDSFTLPRPGKPGIHGRAPRHRTTTSTLAFTKTNTSTHSGVTKASTSNSLMEDYSRNSMSVSSFDEGR
ncbi:cysteine-rich receptor-like protein kinase 10 isoform X2 [Cucumis sativus]|uniref:cysteine-rich receptor-like protein kinase 10 isoform X2 n=1 Tax=Cucumis sativus TaxID=3659 RepID=UPI0005ECD502|nr:cysteine-rich receptor-like protein kinase 10 isoform X2 [Cucumis sativus]KAE8652541.1 hypothetical protein Csa_013128 [Cucumis sativus]